MLDLSSDWTAATSFDGDTTVAPSLDGTAMTGADTSFDISLNRYSDELTITTARTTDTRTTAASHHQSFDLTLNRKGSSDHSDASAADNDACDLLRCLWTQAAVVQKNDTSQERDHHAATLDLLHSIDRAAAAQLQTDEGDGPADERGEDASSSGASCSGVSGRAPPETEDRVHR